MSAEHAHPEHKKSGHHDRKIVVVFGATGQQGGPVVRELVKTHHYHVRAITRDAESAGAKALKKHSHVTVVAADITKPDTFKVGSGVFDGAYAAFLVTNWDPKTMGMEYEQGKGLVDAAAAAKVEHVVWGRLANVAAEANNKYKVAHFTDKARIADYIMTKNFKHVSFPEPAFYYQNFQTFFPPKTENGVLTFTLPATSNISMFDVNDMGAAVTACIEKPSRWGHGNVIPLCGDHLTPQQIVDTFNHANGTKAVVNLVPRDVFAKFPFPGAGELAEMFAWFDDSTYFGKQSNYVEGMRLTQLKSFKDWVHDSHFDGQAKK